MADAASGYGEVRRRARLVVAAVNEE